MATRDKCSIDYSVIVGILGYGDRTPSVDYLALLSVHAAVVKIFIFWNSPSVEVQGSLNSLATEFPKITVCFSSENLGSAGGYIRLIENFRDNEIAPYFLLLDDDLRLAPDCIENLIHAARLRSELPESILFLANRPQLPELANLINKQQGIMRPRSGCCVGFHFLNLFRPLREAVRYSSATGLFIIDSAPWGGLFIPRAALPRLGLPREDFFLYAEDSELTYRFTQNGGKIFFGARRWNYRYRTSLEYCWWQYKQLTAAGACAA